ncbi:MAG: hypothetical protein KAV87_27060 [Desulfobacteraceae bacterium]|nr:hypothetical protein [Desulfobacteraceae bacterium]
MKCLDCGMEQIDCICGSCPCEETSTNDDPVDILINEVACDWQVPIHMLLGKKKVK